MQDLPLILNWDDLHGLDKALDFFKALKLCKSYFNFLNRRKECKVATYLFSVYLTHTVCQLFGSK